MTTTFDDSRASVTNKNFFSRNTKLWIYDESLSRVILIWNFGAQTISALISNRDKLWLSKFFHLCKLRSLASLRRESLMTLTWPHFSVMKIASGRFLEKIPSVDCTIQETCCFQAPKLTLRVVKNQNNFQSTKKMFRYDFHSFHISLVLPHRLKKLLGNANKQFLLMNQFTQKLETEKKSIKIHLRRRFNDRYTKSTKIHFPTSISINRHSRRNWTISLLIVLFNCERWEKCQMEENYYERIL